MQLGHEASHQQYYHQLDEFGHLKMNARPDRNPPRGAPSLFADQQHSNEQANRQQIKRREVRHDRVIVDRSPDPHEQQAGANPDDLLPPGIMGGGAERSTENLHDAQGADDEHDDHHAPVDIPDVQGSAHSFSVPPGAAVSAGGVTAGLGAFAIKLCPSRVFLSM